MKPLSEMTVAELRKRVSRGLEQTLQETEAFDELSSRLEEAEAGIEEWKDKWRYERSHKCPHWGRHLSDGLENVCWYDKPRQAKWREEQAKQKGFDEAKEKAKLLVHMRGCRIGGAIDPRRTIEELDNLKMEAT